MIIWLASYPKSGNTWMRALLANALNNSDEPVHINKLGHWISSVASRGFLDALLGWETSNFNESQNLQYFVEAQAEIGKGPDVILKTHNAYTKPNDGSMLFDPTATRRVLYLIRNPLDVSLSYAKHLGKTTLTTVRLLNNDKLVMGGEWQLRQPMGSWSYHVRSWTEQKDIETMVVRYEDMYSSTVDVLTEVCQFLKIDADMGRIQRAVCNSQLSVLKAQEQSSGFNESPKGVNAFFGEGGSGKWRGRMRDNEVEMVLRKHGAMMKEFGYGVNV